MELSKYKKLEKLGFTFWTKRQDVEIKFQSYFIGESIIALCSSGKSELRLNEIERFVSSVAHFLNKKSVKKINIEEETKEKIKTAFLFNCPKIEILEEDSIKIFSYPSIKEICSSASAKKGFLMKFKEDIVL